MARGGKICIELNFTRGAGDGKSQKAKLKSFWEFIDAREDLVPLQSASQGEISEFVTDCPNSEDVEHQSDACCDNRDDQSLSESVSEEVQSDQLTERGIWHDEYRIFKKLGLDRVALAASDACKRCVRAQRNNVEKEPVFADCVPESYEELATDMKDFQDRIKLQKPQCSYKDPGKFEHLVQ